MTAQNWIGVQPSVLFSVESKSNAFLRISITDLLRISFIAAKSSRKVKTKKSPRSVSRKMKS